MTRVATLCVVTAAATCSAQSAVFDLDAGPVTITLPPAGQRFMSLQIINEDWSWRSAPWSTRRTRKMFSKFTRLQDGIKVSQKSPGRFEVPNWDPASQKKVRDALVALAATIPDFKKAFGRKDQIDPVRHLIGTAAAWGGNPDKDAVYLNITPNKNDGTTGYRLNVTNVPVDGFWSVSVYNAEGYYQKNDYDAYSLNSITAAKQSDGSIAIRLGGCDGKAVNCLPIMKGWNYTVRLYRPRPEILTGKWSFPPPQPAN